MRVRIRITMKKKFNRPGVIPYYFDERGVLKMLFMRPSDPTYGGNQFQIAKGKIDDGETNEAAAFREGFEELGLLPENIVSRKYLGTYLNRTSIFICEINNPNKFGPHTYETGETKRLTYHQFESGYGRDIHIPIVGDAAVTITDLENNSLHSVL